MKDVLCPRATARCDFVTASNCFGSPARIILLLTSFGAVQTPAMKCFSKSIIFRKIHRLLIPVCSLPAMATNVIVSCVQADSSNIM